MLLRCLSFISKKLSEVDSISNSQHYSTAEISIEKKANNAKTFETSKDAEIATKRDEFIDRTDASLPLTAFQKANMASTKSSAKHGS